MNILTSKYFHLYPTYGYASYSGGPNVFGQVLQIIDKDIMKEGKASVKKGQGRCWRGE